VGVGWEIGEPTANGAQKCGGEGIGFDPAPGFCTCPETTINKRAVLPQGNRAMPQVFFSVEVRQH